jgi:hypothetical protein
MTQLNQIKYLLNTLNNSKKLKKDYDDFFVDVKAVGANSFTVIRYSNKGNLALRTNIQKHQVEFYLMDMISDLGEMQFKRRRDTDE